jgi:hypothetical protein
VEAEVDEGVGFADALISAMRSMTLSTCSMRCEATTSVDGAVAEGESAGDVGEMSTWGGVRCRG